MENIDTKNKIFENYKKNKEKIIKNLFEKVENNWSYYGLHDLGINILESFCINIFDLEIKIKDFFSSKIILENNFLSNLDSNNIIISNPFSLFSTNLAVTKNDIWKVVINIPFIKNCKIYSSSEINQNFIQGGYYIYILEENFFSSTDKKITIEQVKKNLYEKRPLCEDFFEIEFLKEKKIYMNLEIEIEKYDKSKCINNFIYEIIDSIQNIFTPEIDFIEKDLYEISTDKIEGIIDGPFIDKGFIQKEKIDSFQIKDFYSKIEIIKILIAKQNLKKIINIDFFNEDGSKIEETIICEKNLFLKINIEKSIFKLIHNYQVIDLKKDDLIFFYSQNHQTKNTFKLKKDKKENFELSKYKSINENIPSFYLSNKKNLSSNQIIPFILFFDQILYQHYDIFYEFFNFFFEKKDSIIFNLNYKFPHYLKNFENYIKLPNSKLSVDRDFFVQKKFLINSSTNLKNKNYMNLSSDYLFKISNLNEIRSVRMNNFLDILIEMFGLIYYHQVDDFSDNLRKNLLIDKKIEKKKNFLENFKKYKSNKDEFCYFSTTEFYKNKLSNFLQINQDKDKNEKYIFEILEKKIKNTNLNSINFNKNLKNDKNAFVIKFTYKTNYFLKSIFKYGTNISNFFISKNKSENLYKLFITCENDKKISIETNLKIKNFSHAKKIISNIHSFLERLDKKTEKIYLLEHILLRQDNFEENDLYKFKISIVMPNWTYRFQNINFRNLCSKIFLEHIPSHIFLDIFWLNFSEMKTFEILYQNWIENFKKNKNSNQTKFFSKNILGFLSSLKK
jgi:hypothetical protein